MKAKRLDQTGSSAESLVLGVGTEANEACRLKKTCHMAGLWSRLRRQYKARSACYST